MTKIISLFSVIVIVGFSFSSIASAGGKNDDDGIFEISIDEDKLDPPSPEFLSPGKLAPLSISPLSLSPRSPRDLVPLSISPLSLSPDASPFASPSSDNEFSAFKLGSAKSEMMSYFRNNFTLALSSDCPEDEDTPVEEIGELGSGYYKTVKEVKIGRQHYAQYTFTLPPPSEIANLDKEHANALEKGNSLLEAVNEIKILRLLKNFNFPHVTQSHGTCVSRSRKGMEIREYLKLYSNGSLLSYSMEESPSNPYSLSGTDIAHVMSQTCSALVNLHSVGIVHRDIKPANILVDAFDPLQGQPIEVALTDWGTAYFIDSPIAKFPYFRKTISTINFGSPQAINDIKLREDPLAQFNKQDEQTILLSNHESYTVADYVHRDHWAWGVTILNLIDQDKTSWQKSKQPQISIANIKQDKVNEEIEDAMQVLRKSKPLPHSELRDPIDKILRCSLKVSGFCSDFANYCENLQQALSSIHPRRSLSF